MKKLIRNYLKKYREYLPLKYQKKYFKCATIKPKKGPIKGRALVSYSITSAGLPKDHKSLDFHSCAWMSNEIISIFNKYGYVVDCIHYNNHNFIPQKKYDAIFSFSGDLLRLVAYAPEGRDAIKIWHPGTSSLKHTNLKEIERINKLSDRRTGALYSPKRQEPYEKMEDAILKLSDKVIVFGENAKRTFHEEFYSKIIAIPVASSSVYIKNKEELVGGEREFIWYFGVGAVLKGLDLILDVFAKNPQWTLNIVGSVESEPDFMKIYKHELSELPNIKLHGHMNPKSKEFRDIIRRCVCFIAPSASESISVACTTMMQTGLYPLVSVGTGVQLPEGYGMYLNDCSVDEIEKKVGQIYNMDEKELNRQISQTQSFALDEYSKERFTKNMEAILSKII